MPLYIQLKEVIIEQIEEKNWKPGDTLPSEVELQKIYDVSRTTVRQAITELVTEGILERIQGKGTYVSQPKLEPIRPEITGFTQDMSSLGHQVSSIVLKQEIIPSNEKLNRILEINSSTQLFKLVRLRLVDGIIIGYQESFINYGLVPHIDLENYDFTNHSLYLYLQDHDVTFSESAETLEASLAGELYSEYLQIDKNAPVLKLSRVIRLQNGKPFEYANMVYRADKYKYSIKLR